MEIKLSINGKEVELTAEQIKLLGLDQKENKTWTPKNGEQYFFVNECSSNINTYTWHGDNTDINLHKFGNCFQTTEQAAFNKEKQKYTIAYKRYIKEHDDKLDWKNIRQPKYYAYYHYTKYSLEINAIYHQKDAGIYASSERIIREAIQHIGEDNFLKYILEIE